MKPRDPSCVFCQIIDEELSADIIWSDDVAVAFLDHSPLFHGHTLVVPNAHVVQLGDLDPRSVGPFFRRVQLLATVIPDALGAQGTFVAMNNTVSQSVAHLHTHVVPRTKGDGLRGFFWPRVKYVDDEATETASRLRASLASFDVDRFLGTR